MDNLALLSRFGAELGAQPEDSLLAFDRIFSVLYLVRVSDGNSDEGPFAVYKIYKDKDSPLQTLKIRLNFGGIPQTASTAIAGFEVFADEQVLFVALRSGELFLVYLEDGSMELVGSLPNGIAACAWAPSLERLAIISPLHELSILTRCFDQVFEGPIDTREGGTDELINVGWGKKETQFHGSEGKAAATSQARVHSILTKDDDRRERLTWRGDSECFACSTVDQSTGARRIRVFDHNGTLVSTSEPIDSLEQSLAWRPDGALIASSQLVPQDTREIIFYERNGLRYGEFRLSANKGPVRELCWNAKSSLLAVLFADGSLQLWYTCNYHWYLKYELPIADINAMLWDPTCPLRLFCLTSSRLESFEFVFEIFRSQCDDSDCFAMAAVVDGAKLCLTPFAIANVPPPMSLLELTLASPVAHVALCADEKRCILAIAFCRAGVQMLEYDLVAGKISSEPKVTGDFPEIRAKRLAMLSGQHIAVLDSAADTTEILLLSNNAIAARQSLGGQIRSLCASGIGFSAVDAKGVLVQFSSAEDLLRKEPSVGGCKDSIGLASHRLSDSEHVLLVDTNHHLYIDGQPVLSGCTSYLAHPEFLVATTIEQRLLFFSWSTPPSQWSESTKATEENVRAIEQGGRIVACVPQQAAVVLQMPRGNLETIYPRAMVLSQLRKVLAALNYREAFLACRRHRVDLNFLHDHNPELFMSTLSRFVAEVDQPDLLNIFLTSLRNENVCASKYVGFDSARLGTRAMDGSFDNKTNRICDAVRTLLTADLVKYVETIMTAYACREPADLESALCTIIALASKDTVPQSAVEKCLKYLIFLTTAERLYEVALGMYELPLALSIARRSQMDPKEYGPFLEALAAVDEITRKFKINDHLKRYSLALQYLAKSEPKFGVCVEYVKRHKLFREACQIYREQGEERGIVLALLADDAASHNDFASAITAYNLAGDYQKSLEACRLAGDWRTAFEIAARFLRLDQSAMHLLALEFAEILLEDKRYKEAATVLMDYANDLPAALRCLCNAASWKEVVRLISKHGCYECIEEILRPKLVEASSAVCEEISNIKKEFEERSCRLEVVHVQNATRHAVVSGDGSYDGSDTLSESSYQSGTTGASRSSKASNKSKKKAERNRLRGKPGSPFEEHFLRDCLLKLAAKLAFMQSSMLSLLVVMAETSLMDEAGRLQADFGNVMEDFEGFFTKSQRWPPLPAPLDLMPPAEQLPSPPELVLPADFNRSWKLALL